MVSFHSVFDGYSGLVNPVQFFFFQKGAQSFPSSLHADMLHILLDSNGSFPLPSTVDFLT